MFFILTNNYINIFEVKIISKKHNYSACMANDSIYNLVFTP